MVEVVSQSITEGSHFAAATPPRPKLQSGLPRDSVGRGGALRQYRQRGDHAGLAPGARAHRTARFLKFEGHYHGWYDPYCLNGHSHPIDQIGPSENPARIPDSEGIPASVWTTSYWPRGMILPALERVMLAHGRELAAVISEPIMANLGCIPPRDGYLEKMRALAHQYGALFILDEVVTGFRYAPGGCQQYYNLEPDLATFGKALGAGFPVGAVAGPREILDRMRWSEHMVLHYGTFNGHRLT